MTSSEISSPVCATAPASSAPSARVLHLPGWQDSGPGHWQNHWVARYGDERVEQDDWLWPKRGDWMAQLEVAVTAQAGPVVLVAHSLGCHLVAAWAAHSRHGAKVRAALLVAPPDVQQEAWPPQLASWRVPVRQRLPFPSLVVASTNDPYCASTQAGALAADWASELVALGSFGHINAESGLGAWPEGRDLLKGLLAVAK